MRLRIWIIHSFNLSIFSIKSIYLILSVFSVLFSCFFSVYSRGFTTNYVRPACEVLREMDLYKSSWITALTNTRRKRRSRCRLASKGKKNQRNRRFTLFENYSKCRIWMFLILAFFTNFCPIKTDLSGNTVWPQASGFQKLAKMDHFRHF